MHVRGRDVALRVDAVDRAVLQLVGSILLLRRRVAAAAAVSPARSSRAGWTGGRCTCVVITFVSSSVSLFELTSVTAPCCSSSALHWFYRLLTGALTRLSYEGPEFSFFISDARGRFSLGPLGFSASVVERRLGLAVVHAEIETGLDSCSSMFANFVMRKNLCALFATQIFPTQLL